MKLNRAFLAVAIICLAGAHMSAASIDVLNPESGKVLKKNKYCTIKWSSSGITSGTYKITLWRGGASLGVISTAIPLTVNQCSWKVGKLINAPDAKVGKGYSIKVRVQGQPVSGISKGITIISPVQFVSPPQRVERSKPGIADLRLAIPVSEPHAGAVWQRAADHKIIWDKSVISGYSNVEIRLLRASDDQIAATLGATRPPNTGQFWWHVSSVLPLQEYRIKVSTPDGKIYGCSAVFSLAADAPPHVTEAFNPQISNARARNWFNHCSGANPVSPGRAPGSLEVKAGHSSAEWRGDDCSLSVTDYFRAQVYFDISGIAGKVQKATLSMRRKEHIMQSPQGTLATNEECTCRTDLYILNSAWSTNQSPLNFYPGDLWKSISLFSNGEKVELDITAIVKEWHQGKRPNHGIMVRKPLEYSHYVGSCCLTYFDRFNLVVEYTRN